MVNLSVISLETVDCETTRFVVVRTWLFGSMSTARTISLVRCPVDIKYNEQKEKERPAGEVERGEGGELVK